MKSEMRQVLARQSFEKKIRKVGKLIRLHQKIKTTHSNASADDILLARLDTASAQRDAGKGVPIERMRENIRG